MTHPVAQATAHAAARARRQATAVAAVGAAVPTVLAAQGMTSLAADVLGFPVLVAIALASFLELALGSAARTREVRPAGPSGCLRSATRLKPRQRRASRGSQP